MVKLSFSPEGAGPSSQAATKALSVDQQSVLPIKRKRRESVSSETSTSSSSTSEAEAAPLREQEKEEKKVTTKEEGKHKRTKKAVSRKVAREEAPIYEDFAATASESPELEEAVKKILLSYLKKEGSKVAAEEEEEQEVRPAKTKKTVGEGSRGKPKSSAQTSASSKKLLLQLSKSFEQLQKKLTKALEDS